MSIYYIDPVNGSDSNAGDSFDSGHPWKTLKHSFTAGVTIYVAKSTQAALDGTVSVNNGSLTITTTNDLTSTCPAGSVVSFPADSPVTLYSTRSATTNTLTLYRPYRGESGSGKTLNLVTPATTASDDWTPTSGTGTETNRITILGGTDTSTLAQDGFTVLKGPGSGNGYNAVNGYDPSNLAFINFYRNWAGTYSMTYQNMTITNCFCFGSWLNTSGGYTGTYKKVDIDGLVVENGPFPGSGTGVGVTNCLWENIETGNPADNGLHFGGPLTNVRVRSWKNTGYSGYPSWRNYNSSGHMYNIDIIDCDFDEMDAGTGCFYLNGGCNSFVHVNNPNIGTRSPLTGVMHNGTLSFSNINGDPNSNQIWFGDSSLSNYCYIESDTSTYKTNPPSAKYVCVSNGSGFLGLHRHLIPCGAGVEKTISVWLRKNSTYGSDTRPKMRLTWFTGSSGSLITNEVEEIMPDETDSWQQVSHAITPGVTGAIMIDIVFQSVNNGANAWYDDLEVT